MPSIPTDLLSSTTISFFSLSLFSITIFQPIPLIKWLIVHWVVNMRMCWTILSSLRILSSISPISFVEVRFSVKYVNIPIPIPIPPNLLGIIIYRSFPNDFFPWTISNLQCGRPRHSPWNQSQTHSHSGSTEVCQCEWRAVTDEWTESW